MKNLQLPLKKKWFEMTKAGIKTEDYREITPYWIKRLFKHPEVFNILNNSCVECKHRTDSGDGILKCAIDNIERLGDEMVCNIGRFEWYYSYFKEFNQNTMTLGYPKSGDTERVLKLEHKGIEIRTGNPEWGAEPNKLYFVIKHGEIL